MDVEQKLKYLNSAKWVVGIILAVATCVYAIIVLMTEKEKRKSDAIKNHNSRIESENTKKEIIGKIEALNVDLSEKVKEGFGFSAILKVNDIADNRRKFILDFGYINQNRVSLYLDKSNSLVFRIIDNEGETYSLKVPHNFYTFKMGATYFIHCDCGYSDSYSFMRLFIDAKEVAQSSFNSKINFPIELDPKKMIIAADLEKKYFGQFTLGYLSVGRLMNKEQIKQEAGDVIRYYESVTK